MSKTLGAIFGVRVTAAWMAVAAISYFIMAVPAVLADEVKSSSDSQVCLDSRLIDHTQVLNDHQILFYMGGKEVWINNLPRSCRALRYDEGFVHATNYPQYCDNMETIRVRPTGQPCLLGKFTPYEKPAS